MLDFHILARRRIGRDLPPTFAGHFTHIDTPAGGTLLRAGPARLGLGVVEIPGQAAGAVIPSAADLTPGAALAAGSGDPSEVVSILALSTDGFGISEPDFLCAVSRNTSLDRTLEAMLGTEQQEQEKLHGLCMYLLYILYLTDGLRVLDSFDRMRVRVFRVDQALVRSVEAVVVGLVPVQVFVQFGRSSDLVFVVGRGQSGLLRGGLSLLCGLWLGGRV